jgi:hypothetical protein
MLAALPLALRTALICGVVDAAPVGLETAVRAALPCSMTLLEVLRAIRTVLSDNSEQGK